MLEVRCRDGRMIRQPWLIGIFTLEVLLPLALNQLYLLVLVGYLNDSLLSLILPLELVEVAELGLTNHLLSLVQDPHVVVDQGHLGLHNFDQGRVYSSHILLLLPPGGESWCLLC